MPTDFIERTQAKMYLSLDDCRFAGHGQAPVICTFIREFLIEVSLNQLDLMNQPHRATPLLGPLQVLTFVFGLSCTDFFICNLILILDTPHTEHIAY